MDNPLPPPSEPEELSAKAMGFLEHLEELRIRLIRIILILAGGTAVGLFFSESLVQFLLLPFHPQNNQHLALLYPVEGFTVRIKVALTAGLFLTSPLWFMQLWGFIGPGLYSRERKVIIPVVAISAGMFLLGAAFGWWMLPYALRYFQSLTVPGVEVSWSLARYIDFVLQILLAFGLIFELPLFIYAAARLGVVTPQTLRRYRRHAIIVILIIAAILTPPDVFTQIILSIPLIILYEVGILAASTANRQRRGRNLAE